MDGGVIIDFIPVWLADAWRAVLWVAMLSLAATHVSLVYVNRQRWRRASIYGTSALMVFLVISAIVTASRWHEPVALEGTPLATLGTVLAFLSLRELLRADGERRFDG